MRMKMIIQLQNVELQPKYYFNLLLLIKLFQDTVDGVVKDEYLKTDADINKDIDNDLEPAKRRRLGKNPLVDTSFLPDIDRDEEEKNLRLVF